MSLFSLLLHSLFLDSLVGVFSHSHISNPILKAKSKPHLNKAHMKGKSEERETLLRRYPSVCGLWWLLALAMGFGCFLYKAWPWLGFREIFYKLRLLFIYKSKEPIFICIQMFSVICISISNVILVWISLFNWW